MKKNFLSPKTGHKASDIYFSQMAVWHDRDIIKSFCFGVIIGSMPFILYLIFNPF